MVPNRPPEFSSLTLTNQTARSLTYLSFGSFDFQQVWSEFSRIGATSCNIHTSADNEAIE